MAQLGGTYNGLPTNFDNTSSSGGSSGPGTPGKDGKDGFSPIVSVEPIDGGHEVTITDISGPKTFDVMNGRDGAKGDKGDTGDPGKQGEPGPEGPAGEDGKDGISPTISVRVIEGGHKVVIDDAIDTKEFDILDGKPGPEGPAGADGLNGVSPTISVDDISGGYRVSITDATGVEEFDVMNGANGRDGEPGENGFSPTVDVTAIDGGHQVTITDVDGPKTFDVMNGKDGVGGEGNNSYLINAPIGAIIAWSGEQNTIPEGWHVCNGEDGTVDLRDKFILGAGVSHAKDETGGEEEVTLTVEQMPVHAHKISRYYGNNVTIADTTKSNTIAPASTNGTLNGDANTYGAGSSRPHNNMPPYLALYYIQKIGETTTDYTNEERVREIVREYGGSVDIGETLVDNGGVIDVKTPVERILTEQEFNALPPEKQNRGVYFVDSPDQSLQGVTIEEYDTEVDNCQWHVRKWSNGYVEFMGMCEYQNVSMTSSYITDFLYNSEVLTGVRFPFALTKKYVEEVRILNALNGNNNAALILTSYGTNVALQKQRLNSFRVVWHTKSENINFTLSAYVTGRWKGDK